MFQYSAIQSCLNILRKYFGNSGVPFAVKVAGEKLIIVTNPKHAGEIFKNTTTLSFDGLIRMIHRGVANVSISGYKTLWRTPVQGFQSLYPNPKNNVLVHTGNALLHKQVLHGEPLERLTERFKDYLEVMTRPNALTKDAIVASDGNLRVMLFHKCLQSSRRCPDEVILRREAQPNHA